MDAGAILVDEDPTVAAALIASDPDATPVMVFECLAGAGPVGWRAVKARYKALVARPRGVFRPTERDADARARIACAAAFYRAGLGGGRGVAGAGSVGGRDAERR